MLAHWPLSPSVQPHLGVNVRKIWQHKHDRCEAWHRNDGGQNSFGCLLYKMINIACTVWEIYEFSYDKHLMAANNEVTTVSLTSLGDWVLSPVILTWFISALETLFVVKVMLVPGKCSQLLSLRQNIRHQQIKWNLTVIIKLTADLSLAGRSCL